MRPTTAGRSVIPAKVVVLVLVVLAVFGAGATDPEHFATAMNGFAR
jgi:hypothetical protein